MAITSPNQLEAWLKDKPDEWAGVIALRVSLRVLPFALTPIIEFEDQSWTEDRFRLMVFRANLVSYVAVSHADSPNIAAAAASDAANAASDAAGAAAAANAAIRATKVITSAIAAADAAIAAATTTAANAAFTAGDAARAAAYIGVARNEIWSLIDQDVHALEAGAKVEELANAPVFGSEKSQFLSLMKDRFYAFINRASDQPGWQVWADWYQAIAFGESAGSPWGQKAELEIALKDDDFWQRDPDLVNGHIERIIQNSGPSDKGSKSNQNPKQPDHSNVQDSHGSKDQSKNDKTQIRHDRPTQKDQLGRREFVRTLANMMKEAMPPLETTTDQRSKDGLMVNVHASWGAGKTSVLNMLEHELTQEERAQPWIVVEFNAWRHERRNPPWWPLLVQLKKDISKGSWPTIMSDWRYLRTHLRWGWWRFLSEFMPVLVALLFPSLAVFLVWTLNLGGDENTSISVITGLLTLAGSGFLLTRGLIFGSKARAIQHIELTRDPLGPLHRLFKGLVKRSNRRICIFIDDLDRCNADYVVDFLEGIQTAFRHQHVVYVVAADRKWIKSAFEHRYDTAFGQSKDTGQPLGYLFLEKIFQISVPLPSPPDHVQQAYWKSLLPDETQELDPAEPSDELAKKIEDDIAQVSTHEGVETIIRDYDLEALPDAHRARLWERAYEQVSTSSEESRNREHRLARLGSLVPFNPRVMKRLNNIYGLRHGEFVFTDNVEAKLDALARWLVLEQSYPGLTDILAEHPNWADHFHAKIPTTKPQKDKIPSQIANFVYDQKIRDIFTHKDYGETLSPDYVSLFTRMMR